MEKRFILPVALLVILIPFFLSFLSNFFEFVGIQNIILQIPGPASTDLFYVLALIPLATIIFALFARPLGNLLVRVHGLIKLGKYGYKIETLGERFGLGDFLKRAIYPSLFCFTLGLTQTQQVMFTLINIFNLHPREAQLSAVPLAFVFGLYMVPIAALLWSPIWVLEDSGVVAFLKPEERDRRQTPDTEGVGRYYRTYLNGFVGVSTIIGLGTFLYNAIMLQLDLAARPEALIGLVVLFLIPFYALLAFSPLLLVHEFLFKNHREKLTQALVKQKVVEDPENQIPKEKTSAVEGHQPSEVDEANEY